MPDFLVYAIYVVTALTVISVIAMLVIDHRKAKKEYDKKGRFGF